MSIYEQRYHAQFGTVSAYAQTPEDVLDLVKFYGESPKWIAEGYAQESSSGNYVYRKNTRTLLLSEIEYLVQKNYVQRLIKGANNG